MKTVKNAAFLVFVAGLLISPKGTVAAVLGPTYEECSDGCDCNTDNINPVSITCADASDADVCNDVYSSCSYYCEATLANYLADPFPPTCWINDVDGCHPAGLDPPADLSCSCWCQS